MSVCTNLIIAASVAAALLLSSPSSNVFVSATTPVVIRGTCNAQCGVIYSNLTCNNDTWCEWWPYMNLTKYPLVRPCQEKCPNVNNRVTCMKLSHCTWNYGTKACQRACYTFPPEQCGVNVSATACQLSRDGNSCLPKCSPWTTRASCNALWPTCSFNTTNSTCLPGCGGFPSEDLCGNAMGCVWLRAVNLCVPQCSSAATTNITCGFNETIYCSWKNGKCMERCDFRYVSSDRCVTSDCDVFTTTTPYTCYDNCSALGYNESTCNSYRWCTWDEKTPVCRKNCMEITDQTICGSTAHCDWTAEFGCVKKCNVGLNVSIEIKYCTQKPWCYFDSVDQVCTIRCRSKYFTAVQSTFLSSCTADPRCVVVAGEECRESCSRLDGVTCRSIDRCFSNNNTVCEDRCDTLTSSSSCTSRSSCEWEDARSQCREICSAFSYNSTECTGATAAHCVWLGATRTCATGCQLTSACPTGAHCVSKNSVCVTGCSFLDSTQCGTVARCFWSTYANVCKDACKVAYTDSNACNGDNTCEWLSASNICQEKCVLFNSTSTQCLINSHCSYNYNKSFCFPNCMMRYVGGSECDSTSGCETLQPSGSCRNLCSGIFNSTACGWQPNCRWNTTSRVCEQSCYSKYMLSTASASQVACDADSLCEWRRDGTCGQRCLVATDATNCTNTSSVCLWVANATCLTPCWVRGSLASCESTTDCQWFEKANACRPSCALLPNSTACHATFAACSWRGILNQCNANCESRYDTTTSNARCMADPLCTMSLGRCVNRCGFMNSLQCRISTSCSWYGPTSAITGYDSNGLCVTMCSDREVSDCTMDDQCFLFNGTSCFPKCSTFTNSILCESQLIQPVSGWNLCSWNMLTQSCQVSCQIRYWQNVTSFFSGNCSADYNCRWNGIGCDPSCPTIPLGSVSNQRVYAKTLCTAYGACASYAKTSTVDSACGTMNCPSGSACSTTAGCFLASNSSSPTSCFINCSQYPTLAQCPTFTNCEWISNADPSQPAGCQLSCVDKYGSNQTGCTFDANCYWDTTVGGANKCKMNCARATKDLCGLATFATHCSWNSSSSTCALACSYLSSSSACSIPGCFWTAGAACRPDCAGQSRSACLSSAVSSGCVWNDAASACQYQCGQRYYMDNTLYSTNPSLATQYLRVNCSMDPVCMYMVGTSNVTSCVNNCNGLNQSTCGSGGVYSTCTWSTLNSRCVPDCSVRWANTKTKLYETDCLADTTCWLDRNPPFGLFITGSGLCTNLCDSITYQNSTDCRDNCIYDYNQKKCIPKCSSRVNTTLVSTMCNALPQSECRYRLGQCMETCQTFAPSATNVSLPRLCGSVSSAGCLFNSTSSQCEVGCWNYTSEMDCNSTVSNNCLWRSGSCVPRCSGLTKTMCSGFLHCSWQPLQQVCRPVCSYYSNTFSSIYQANCQGDSNCEWMTWVTSTTTVVSGATVTISVTNNQCVERCYQLEQNSCVVNSYYCMWNYRLGQCQRACRWKYLVKDACIADSGCQWFNDACTEKCSLFSPVACPLLANCVYGDAARACLTTCGNKYVNWTGLPSDTFQTDCSNDGDCFLGTNEFNGLPKCYNKCINFDNKGCRNQVHCMWNDITGKCVLACHDRYRAMLWGTILPGTGLYDRYNNSCAADADGVCMVGHRGASWKCDPKCSIFLTPENCRFASDTCIWSEASGKCIQKCSRRYDTVNTNLCETDVDCRSGCLDRCDYQRTMYGCENITSCRWSQNNTCLPDCLAMNRTTCLSYQLHCDWDGSSGFGSGCRQQCSTLINETRCNTLGTNCVWSNVTNLCTKYFCSNYLTQDACLGDPISCDWIVSPGGSGTCRQACRSYSDSVNCTVASAGNCVWVETERRCAVQCEKHYPQSDSDRTGCALESHCMWWGRRSFTRTTDPSFDEKCGLRCEVRNNQISCITGFSAITPVCAWDEVNSVCRTSCNALYTTQSDCVADMYCQWFIPSNTSGLQPSCQTNCNLYNAVTCDTKSPYCAWYDLNKTCQRSCEMMNYTIDTDCYNDTRCWWSNATNTCNRKCNTTGIYGTCVGSINRGQCAWYSPNETARFSIRTALKNVSGLAYQFAWLLGVYTDNVTVTLEGTGCNTSVATIEVNATESRVMNAIVAGATTYSYTPRYASLDVIEFGEQGSIVIRNPSAAPSGMLSAFVVGMTVMMMMML